MEVNGEVRSGGGVLPGSLPCLEVIFRVPTIVRHELLLQCQWGWTRCLPSLFQFLQTAFALLAYSNPPNHLCPCPHSRISLPGIRRDQIPVILGVHSQPEFICLGEEIRGKVVGWNHLLYFVATCNVHISVTHPRGNFSFLPSRRGQRDMGPASVHNAWKSGGFSGLYWT